MTGAIGAAAVVVLSGALITVFAAFSLSGNAAGIKRLFVRTGRIKKDARLLFQLAADIRPPGSASIEKAAEDVTDPFLREALLLASGGIDAESLRDILTLRTRLEQEAFEEAERFWQFTASACSAWGMIGALAGLALAESENGIDGFAFAVWSAGLGVFTSQCLALAAAFRMKRGADRELRRRRMITEGLVSVKSGDAPRVCGEKLKSFGGLDGDLIE
jgi:chemotaxis protein MotA